MRLTASSFATALLLAASTLAAHADTYHYDFIATTSSLGFDFTFTYDSPVLITTDAILLSTPSAPLNCIVNGAACAKLEIDPTAGNILGTDFAGNESGVLDVDRSESTVGTHIDRFGYFTLAITDVPDQTSPVPEPSSIALLSTGLLGLTGIARRKPLQILSSLGITGFA